MTPHRRRHLDALATRGIRVHWLFGVYGASRDGLIARSRLVLNLHKAPGSPFEAVRVAYLLANRVPVVAEGEPTGDPDARPWMDGVAWAVADALPAVCAHLLADAPARAQLAEAGFRVVTQRPEARYLEAVLDQMADDGVLAAI